MVEDRRNSRHTLGAHNLWNYYSKMCTGLLSLPRLRLFKIVENIVRITNNYAKLDYYLAYARFTLGTSFRFFVDNAIFAGVAKVKMSQL